MMPGPPYLRCLRQQVFEMALPPRWVLAHAIAAGRRPIQDALDAAAQPARGFWLLGPDRLEYAHDQCEVGRRDRQLTDYRIGITRQRCRPLRGMSRVPPASSLGGDVGLGT